MCKWMCKAFSKNVNGTENELKSSRHRRLLHHWPPPSPAAHGTSPASTRGRVVGGPRRLNGLVHGENEAGGFGCGRDCVYLDNGRLPHTSLEVLGNIFIVDIDAVPHATYNNRGFIVGREMVVHKNRMSERDFKKMGCFVFA